MPTTSSIPSSITGKREKPVRRADDILRGVGALDAGDAGAGRHHILCGVVREGECAGEQRRGVAIEAALARRPPHERSELLSRARTRQALLRLDADESEDRVGGRIEEGHCGRKTAVNPTWNGTTTFATARGRARARFLGTTSPMIIESRVATVIARIDAMTRTTGAERPRAVSGTDSHET